MPELSRTAQLARDLIRFPSVNRGEGRSDGEGEAAAYVEAVLRDLGLQPRLLESAPGRTSVVARVDGERPGPGLVVHGHLDVVPADPANWSVDPFAGEVRDGLLWGRGAVDMKDMDAMMLAAVERIVRADRRPARDLTLAFFADEEAGGDFGAHWVVDHHPELFAGATEAISEVGGWSAEVGGKRAYLLQTGEKALIWIRLTVRGTAGHGSRLVRDNAVVRLAEAVAAIGRREWPLRLTDTTTELVGHLARLLDLDVREVGEDGVVLAAGSASGFIQATLRTTANPTVLTAGYKHNVIPDLATALVDVRTLPGEEDAVLAEIRELVGPDVEVTTVHRDVGLENPFAGPLVDEIVALLGEHDPGAEVLPYLLSGGTDNKALSKLGITGYGFVPLRLPPELNFPAMFHGVDERVPLASLDFGTDVLTDLLLRY